MQEVLVNRLGGLSLSRESVVRLTGRPDMTLDVYRGRKTTIQEQQPFLYFGALKKIKILRYLNNQVKIKDGNKRKYPYLY